MANIFAPADPKQTFLGIEYGSTVAASRLTTLKTAVSKGERQSIITALQGLQASDYLGIDKGIATESRELVKILDRLLNRHSADTAIKAQVIDILTNIHQSQTRPSTQTENRADSDLLLANFLKAKAAGDNKSMLVASAGLINKIGYVLLSEKSHDIVRKSEDFKQQDVGYFDDLKLTAAGKILHRLTFTDDAIYTSHKALAHAHISNGNSNNQEANAVALENKVPFATRNIGLQIGRETEQEVGFYDRFVAPLIPQAIKLRVEALQANIPNINILMESGVPNPAELKLLTKLGIDAEEAGKFGFSLRKFAEGFCNEGTRAQTLRDLYAAYSLLQFRADQLEASSSNTTETKELNRQREYLLKQQEKLLLVLQDPQIIDKTGSIQKAFRQLASSNVGVALFLRNTYIAAQESAGYMKANLAKAVARDYNAAFRVALPTIQNLDDLTAMVTQMRAKREEIIDRSLGITADQTLSAKDKALYNFLADFQKEAAVWSKTTDTLPNEADRIAQYKLQLQTLLGEHEIVRDNFQAIFGVEANNIESVLASKEAKAKKKSLDFTLILAGKIKSASERHKSYLSVDLSEITPLLPDSRKTAKLQTPAEELVRAIIIEDSERRFPALDASGKDTGHHSLADMLTATTHNGAEFYTTATEISRRRIPCTDAREQKLALYEILKRIDETKANDKTKQEAKELVAKALNLSSIPSKAELDHKLGKTYGNMTEIIDAHQGRNLVTATNVLNPFAVQTLLEYQINRIEEQVRDAETKTQIAIEKRISRDTVLFYHNNPSNNTEAHKPETADKIALLAQTMVTETDPANRTAELANVVGNTAEARQFLDVFMDGAKSDSILLGVSSFEALSSKAEVPELAQMINFEHENSLNFDTILKLLMDAFRRLSTALSTKAITA